jgi:hypothetical protein
MRIGAAFGWAILGGLVIVACGSSSSDGGSSATACTAGASVACIGAGGCSGGQVCNASGTSYGDCVCGGGTDSGPPPNDSGSPVVDGGNDSGASFTPKDLSGLVLWSDGQDFGDGGVTVPAWPDQSGKTHDLLMNPPLAAPTRHASAVAGKDALTFATTGNGTQLLTNTTNDFGIGTDNFVVEMVSNPGACSIPCTLWLLFGASSPVGVTSSIHSGVLTESFQTNSGLPDMTTGTVSAGWHVMGLRRTSTTAAEMRIDGTATPITLSTNYDLSGTYSMTVGAGLMSSGASPVAYNLDGDIAEVVIVHNPSDADVTNLEAYLKSKYGL